MSHHSMEEILGGFRVTLWALWYWERQYYLVTRGKAGTCFSRVCGKPPFAITNAVAPVFNGPAGDGPQQQVPPPTGNAADLWRHNDADTNAPLFVQGSSAMPWQAEPAAPTPYVEQAYYLEASESAPDGYPPSQEYEPLYNNNESVDFQTTQYSNVDGFMPQYESVNRTIHGHGAPIAVPDTADGVYMNHCQRWTETRVSPDDQAAPFPLESDPHYQLPPAGPSYNGFPPPRFPSTDERVGSSAAHLGLAPPEYAPPQQPEEADPYLQVGYMDSYGQQTEQAWRISEDGAEASLATKKSR